MSTNEKLLTIGIPTYNGARTIRECVLSCLESIDNAKGTNVEILVVDNASTDNTKEILLEILESHMSTIRIINNKENIGLDRNIDKIFQESKGRFVKLLGDDDVLGVNFVSKELEILSSYEVDLVLNNYSDYDNGRFSSNEIREYRTYSNDFEILVTSKGVVGQIASITFKRNSYLKYMNPSLNGTNHKFLYISYLIISQGISIYNPNTNIFVRSGSPRFTEKPLDSLTMQLNSLRALKLILQGRDNWSTEHKTFLNKAIRDQCNYGLTFMDFIHRRSNKNSLYVILRFFPIGKFNCKYYFYYIPITLVPKFLGNFLAKLLKNT